MHLFYLIIVIISELPEDFLMSIRKNILQILKMLINNIGIAIGNKRKNYMPLKRKRVLIKTRNNND